MLHKVKKGLDFKFCMTQNIEKTLKWESVYLGGR